MFSFESLFKNKNRTEMSKVQITLKEAIELTNLAASYAGQDFRLKHAMSKNVKTLKKFIDQYNEDSEDLSIKYASEKDGILIKSENGFDFTKENQKEYGKARRDLMNKDVEFEPYILPVVKELGKLGAGMLAILEPLLPENYVDLLEELQENGKEITHE